MNANPLKQPRRFPALAGIPLLAGTCWLWETAQAGLAPFLLALPASGGLLAGGLALLLWAGDRRISQIVALAGGVGTLAFPLLALGLGAGAAFWLSLLAGASALAAASLAIDLTPPIEDVPRPEPGLGLSASVAMDEMVLGLEQLSMSIPSGDAAHQMADEVDAALALYRDRGWLDRPLDYHRARPPLTAPVSYTHLTLPTKA